MSRPALSLLVDTNVWIDNFDGRRRSKRASCEFLDLACKRGIELLFAASSVKDVYYIVMSQLKAHARKATGEVSAADAAIAEQYARRCVDGMAEVACAIGVDMSDVWLARKYQRIHPDFEDCLIMAAATRAKASYVITADERFLRNSSVPAISPKQAIALLED